MVSLRLIVVVIAVKIGINDIGSIATIVLGDFERKRHASRIYSIKFL